MMDFRPKEYDCKICGATYHISTMLNEHIRETHYAIDARTDGMKIDDLQRRVDALEARVRILETENDTMKAGK